MNPKQTLQGKLTYIGVLISAAGAVGNLFGWEIPADEVKGMITWTQAHWDDLAQFAGLITAAYGLSLIHISEPTRPY